MKKKIVYYKKFPILMLLGLQNVKNPYTLEQILSAFYALSLESKIQSSLKELLLNDTHKPLNNERGKVIVNDYICIFSSSDVCINLGCCFFNFKDIKNFSKAEVLETTRFLLPTLCQAQPLIMRQFANKCYEKIQDVFYKL